MELKWLEDVIALLEEGSMSRAAMRRNVTQPAFSRRLRSLEDWLGVQLLERRANSVILRANLVANEPQIRSLVQQMREFRAQINAFEPRRMTIPISAQHSLIFSAFSDMASRAKESLSALDFRLRVGNRSECVSFFLRGETHVLLCYEDELSAPLPFDKSVQRHIWGKDALIPVVGGHLREHVRQKDSARLDLPAIIYPESSHFGGLLRAANKPFAEKGSTRNPFCETAFSAGAKEMVLKGLGVAWLPESMIGQEIDHGTVVGLQSIYGQVDLTIAYYLRSDSEISTVLNKIWQNDI